MTAITRYDAMRGALVAAHRIDDVKDIRDKAEALRQYAKQAGESLENQNMIAEIKLRAERRAGELLGEMERVQPEDTLLRGNTMKPREELPPTLSDLGISKSQSSRWQSIAEIPEPVFEQHITETKASGNELTTAGALKVAKEQRQQTQRKERAEAERKAALSTPEYRLIVSDVKTLDIEGESVDAIITDPPYPEEYLHCYATLSDMAQWTLKPGGSMFVMVGQSYLPQLIENLGKHMIYHWTLAYLTPGGQAPHLFARRVNAFWKPVLWYVKDGYSGKTVGDVCKSDTNDNDKRFHHWGQSVSGMADLVKRVTEPGALILDPFCGAGTTGVAALLCGRKFIGSDIDEKHVASAALRLSEAAETMRNANV